MTEITPHAHGFATSSGICYRVAADAAGRAVCHVRVAE
jgi:hypothetical protein